MLARAGRIPSGRGWRFEPSLTGSGASSARTPASAPGRVVAWLGHDAAAAGARGRGPGRRAARRRTRRATATADADFLDTRTLTPRPFPAKESRPDALGCAGPSHVL